MNLGHRLQNEMQSLTPTRVFVTDDVWRVVAVLARLRTVEEVDVWVFVFHFALVLTSAYTAVAVAAWTKHSEIPAAAIASVITREFVTTVEKNRRLRSRTHLALARCQGRQTLKSEKQPGRMVCLDDAQNGALVFFFTIPLPDQLDRFSQTRLHSSRQRPGCRVEVGADREEEHVVAHECSCGCSFRLVLRCSMAPSRRSTWRCRRAAAAAALASSIRTRLALDCSCGFLFCDAHSRKGTGDFGALQMS